MLKASGYMIPTISNPSAAQQIEGWCVIELDKVAVQQSVPNLSAAQQTKRQRIIKLNNFIHAMANVY
jgi:hypothetical protein